MSCSLLLSTNQLRIGSCSKPTHVGVNPGRIKIAFCTSWCAIPCLQPLVRTKIWPNTVLSITNRDWEQGSNVNGHPLSPSNYEACKYVRETVRRVKLGQVWLVAGLEKASPRSPMSTKGVKFKVHSAEEGKKWQELQSSPSHVAKVGVQEASLKRGDKPHPGNIAASDYCKTCRGSTPAVLVMGERNTDLAICL